MAVAKISDLPEIDSATVAPHEDVLEITDTSGSTSRKIKASTLLGRSPDTDVTSSTYSFALSDAFRTVIFNSSSAQTVTIPANASVALPVGTRIRAYRKGAGTVKLVPDSGVTFNLPTGIVPKRLMGARANGTAASGLNFTAPTIVPFAGANSYDTDNFHDTVTNNTRMTIPAGLGIKKVNLNASARYTNDVADRWKASYFLHCNSAGTVLLDFSYLGFEAGANVFETVNTVLNYPVSDGDYIEFWVRSESGTALVYYRSMYTIEVAEIDAQGWIAYQHGSIEVMKIAADEWIVSDQTALG